MAARKADKDSAILVFSMVLDSERCVIPGLNRGRLALIDKEGLIQRWVCSSSYDGKQKVNDWTKRGGIIPPTSSMPGLKHWEFHTRLIVQPGQPVTEGYLITHCGSIEYRTTEGSTRSEIMVHDDANRDTNEGSAGCVVTMNTSEWVDLKRVVLESVSHIKTIPMFSIYTY